MDDTKTQTLRPKYVYLSSKRHRRLHVYVCMCKRTCCLLVFSSASIAPHAPPLTTQPTRPMDTLSEHTLCLYGLLFDSCVHMALQAVLMTPLYILPLGWVAGRALIFRVVSWLNLLPLSSVGIGYVCINWRHWSEW